MLSIHNGSHGSPILFSYDIVEFLQRELWHNIVVILFLTFYQFLLEMYEFVAIYLVLLTCF